jgi:hypothetical protein
MTLALLPARTQNGPNKRADIQPSQDPAIHNGRLGENPRMKRIVLASLLSAAVFATFPVLYAHAQMDKKTGRTEDGVKIDAEIDRLYRARAGQKTPEVRSDPWGDVRTPPANQPAAKTTTTTTTSKPK